MLTSGVKTNTLTYDMLVMLATAVDIEAMTLSEWRERVHEFGGKTGRYSQRKHELHVQLPTGEVYSELRLLFSVVAKRSSMTRWSCDDETFMQPREGETVLRLVDFARPIDGKVTWQT